MGIANLECKKTNTTSALNKNVVPSFQWLHAEERIPTRQPSAAQGTSLLPAEVFGGSNETGLGKDGIISQCAIKCTTEAGLYGLDVDRSCLVTLIE